MARKTKTKSSSKSKSSPKRRVKATKPARAPREPGLIATWWAQLDRSQRGSVILNGVLAVVGLALLGTIAGGLVHMDGRLQQRRMQQPTRSFDVDFVSKPAWMSKAMIREMAFSLVPKHGNYYDPDLTETVHELAEKNPWIQEVRFVKKEWGEGSARPRLVIDASFRQAIARVDAAGKAIYLDAQGYRVPSSQVPHYLVRVRKRDGGTKLVARLSRPADGQGRRIHYVQIRGAAQPHPAIGERWQGEDMADALRLLGLLLEREYVSEMSVIDIRNHDGRIDPYSPEIAMYAQKDNDPATHIGFGRFPEPGPHYVVSPERKLENLDLLYRDHGRISGLCESIDLTDSHLHARRRPNN
ncbi:MAG: hypothetical protein ACLFV7_10445 [Phycisphaerae bacterium]